MRAPVVLWQPHGETGRALVSEFSGDGGLPVVVLQPDDQTLGATTHCAASELSVIPLSGHPPSMPDIVHALEDMLELWGSPSGVVLTPPAGPSAPFHELTVNDWRAAVEGSFLATVFLLRAIIPLALAGPAARVVTVLPDDPPVGRNDRMGTTANSALRAALHATVTELSREPSAADILWFTLGEGRVLCPDVASRVPAPAGDGSAPGLARLSHWLIRHGPADLSGADLCLPPPAADR